VSRSGYTDDCDGWALIRWRGAVASAIRGKRGQSFLREMLAALDAMEPKELIAHELVADGGHCALGVVGAARGMSNLASLDPENHKQLEREFGVSSKLIQEIEYMNDDTWVGATNPDAKRWQYMRAWVAEQIVAESAPPNEQPQETQDK
jgi:hypothetical protein